MSAVMMQRPDKVTRTGRLSSVSSLFRLFYSFVCLDF